MIIIKKIKNCNSLSLVGNSSVEMVFEASSFSVFLIHTFLWYLLSLSIAPQVTESDISCLKSIKNSLEDPFKVLSSSWSFNSNTKGFICRFAGVECWHPDENRVLNLNLSYMGLKGQFPRGIMNCSSLVGLNLSYNQLSGPIPSDISSLFAFATILDLSNNKFIGQIPAGLADCSYLNVLKLDNNHLSGHISRGFMLLGRMKEFSVANNHLTGPVPVFKHDVFVNFANNSGLCGGPIGPCHKEIPFHISFRYGLVIGFLLAFTSVVVVFFSWEKYKKNKNKDKHGRRNSRKLKKQNKDNQRPAYLLCLELLKKESNEIAALLETMISPMSFRELCDATNSFSAENTIGVGRMGKMYKATLPNGWFLAIKKIHEFEVVKRHFAFEVIVLGKYRHTNIVPLIGFCMESEERILVYQYMSNGRLYDWLHYLESDHEDARLEWPVRANIALGIARGLSWLHHNLHVVHLGIRSEGILLDQKFEPKISNFGDAKFMSLSQERLSIKLSFMKKDVYDFGAMLFELITGKKFSQVREIFESNKDQLGASSSNLLGNPSIFYSAIDGSLISKGYDDEIFTLAGVASDCIHQFLYQRPSMLEVYNNINKIAAKYAAIIP